MTLTIDTTEMRGMTGLEFWLESFEMAVDISHCRDEESREAYA